MREKERNPEIARRGETNHNLQQAFQHLLKAQQ
jgi:hypothetical protein